MFTILSGLSPVLDYSDQSSDPGGLQKSADGSRGPLLALGFHGKVELVYAFVGASEACMLVVPRVAATLDAPFLPSPGILAFLTSHGILVS